MKDSFDMVQDVRSLINIPAVLTLLDGGNIYPDVRPTGRTDKIDIVIGSLNLNNRQWQVGQANIRIYAPDISIFPTLTELLLHFLDNQYRESFFTEVDIPGELIRDADGSYFCLIRVSYQSYNSNYNNI